MTAFNPTNPRIEDINIDLAQVSSVFNTSYIISYSFPSNITLTKNATTTINLNAQDTPPLPGLNHSNTMFEPGWYCFISRIIVAFQNTSPGNTYTIQEASLYDSVSVKIHNWYLISTHMYYTASSSYTGLYLSANGKEPICPLRNYLIQIQNPPVTQIQVTSTSSYNYQIVGGSYILFLKVL
jgi:hypothetical protein